MIPNCPALVYITASEIPGSLFFFSFQKTYVKKKTNFLQKLTNVSRFRSPPKMPRPCQGGGGGLWTFAWKQQDGFPRGKVLDSDDLTGKQGTWATTLFPRNLGCGISPCRTEIHKISLIFLTYRVFTERVLQVQSTRPLELNATKTSSTNTTWEF